MKRTILISSLVLLYVVGLSSAATRNVPADYPTIQAAINAAVDGVDDVNVADNIYTGAGNTNLNFGGKAITVKSANGPANCIIDCQAVAGRQGFNFFNGEGAGSVVNGFTIINGNTFYGGGIECYRSSPTIFGCVIKDNHADFDGGGIACFESSSTIKNCLFVNNSAGDFGGAICCDGSSASITLCTFSGNTAGGAGGGIYCYYDADATIKYAIFQGCGSHAIFEDDIDSDPLVKYCLFSNNPDGDYYDFDTALTYTGGSQINVLAGGNTGNIDGDPMFRTGPQGDYYQSQKSAGQLGKGPGVDAGDIYAVDAGMDIYTTATNGLTDWRGLDLGYHYIPATVPQYSVTVSVVGGNGLVSVEEDDANFISGNTYGPYDQYSEKQVVADPCVGYKVRQWTGTDDDLSKEHNNVVTITTDKAVSVEFEPRAVFQLTTIVVGGLGGTIDPPTGPQYEGQRVLLTAIPELGYTVKAWTGTEDDSSMALTNYVTMDSPVKTVTVEFIYSTVYLDTAVIGGHGRIRPRSGNYPVDLLGLSPVTLTATPDYGYQVKQWGGDAEGVPFLDPNDPTHNTVTMTESKSVTVEFEIAPLFDLTLSVIGGHGTLVPTYPAPVEYDPVSGIYTYYNGAVITIEATPDTGYRLKQWGGDVDNPSATGLTNTVTISNRDANATVEFEGIPQVWVFKPEPDGTLTLRYDYYFTTIQAGINAAHSGFPGYLGDPEAEPVSLPAISPVEGDVVVVSDGVYTGSGNYNLDFGKGTGSGEEGTRGMSGHLPGRDVPGGYTDSYRMAGDSKRITVRSENGPENCIIDCGRAGRGYYFHQLVEDNNCVVEGFTIKGGAASVGGGAYCRGISAPVFRNCIFTDNFAITGGGIGLEGVAEGDTTYEDIVDETEGEIANLDLALVDDPNLIDDTDFQNHYRAVSIWAIMLGGIVDYATSGEEPNMPVVSNCKITANASNSHGGGIYCAANASPLIITSEITGNLAGHAGLPGAHGGGIFCSEEGTAPAIINCLIAGNISTEIGGAMYLFFSAPIINLCTIANNYGLHYVYMPDGVTPIPIGGIAGREASPTITNCIIGRNGTAGTWGDGLSYGDDLYPDDITAAFSCIENPDDAEGNIDDDPLFISGGLGDYYLFQEHFDRRQNSPCVDAGEQYVLVDLQGPPPDGYNLDPNITTSVKNNYDFGFADMGYHYPFYVGPPVEYQLRIEVIGNGYVVFQDANGTPILVEEATEIRHFLPGTQILLRAHADPNHWGYWYGTDNDESFNTYNYVTMYSDRDVTVEFEPILRRKLHVPADYALLQDAIDAAKYGDTVVLAAGGSNNPYFTTQGFVVRDNKAITITSVDPNDPDTIAATVIEMETPQDGGWVSRAFRFVNVGPDTVLNGITIRGFNWRALDGLDGDEELEPGENGSSAYGGAILCSVASPTIKNCVIEDCSVFGGDGGNGMPGTTEHPDGIAGGWPGGAGGAGLACFSNSSPTIMNCTFDDCNVVGGNGGDGGDGLDGPPGWGQGGRGGGWYYGADSYWYNVPWPRGPYNFYTEYSGRGGAVFVGEDCSPKFIDCTFSSNSSEGGLCGICGIDGEPRAGRAKPGLHWKIDNFGAAAFCDDGSEVEFDNCSFINNLASPNRPTRDYNEPYDPETNYDNDDLFVGFGGAVAFKTGANVTFNDCRFERNLGDKGGAIHCRDAKPQINDCSFVGNSAQTGGAVLFARGYGRIARSDFIENEAIGAVGQGGAICSLGSNALISDCNVTNNIASESGGAAYVSSKNVDGNDLVIEGETVFGYNKVVFFNCLITRNTACDDGGAISANYEAEPDIINCTIADNAVLEECGSDIGYGGGLISTTGSFATVLDSIIWGNSANLGSQIAIGITPSPSVVEVVASDIQGARSNAYIGTGSTLDWDTSNLYTDPLFVSGPLGGYYLSQIVAGQLQESPCVDAGSDLAVRVGMSEYTTRTDEVFDGGIVDMGYHHSFTTMEQPCKFCNLADDGIINFADYEILASRFLDEGCNAGNNWCLDADLTFDTRVNIDDLLIFSKCWLLRDTEPPEPDPSQWKRAPYSASTVAPYRISMTAKPSVDRWSDTVEYYFDCNEKWSNCHDRNWDSSNTYTDTGLVKDVEYSYRVKARDGNGNETGWSGEKHAITGMVPPPPEDHNAPVPDPMTWAVAPHSTSAASIAMTATTAVDLEESGVEYYFECVTNDVNSGWIAIPTWEDTNLTPTTTYAYRVKARDKSLWHNETGWSIVLGATTGIEDTETPTPDPLTWAIEPYAISPTRVGMVATTATDISGVEYYFECTSHAQYSSGWRNSPVYEVNVAEGALYTFVVRARDKSANQNTTGDSPEVAADPDPPAPNPMTWAVEPYRTSATSVSMTASLATDVSGVEYYFQCTSHSAYNSGWRTGRTYTVSGLPTGQYTFVVRARDRSPARNTTGDSAELSIDLNPPAPVAWEVAPYETGSGFDAFANMTAAEAIDAEGFAVEYYFECVDVSQFSSGWTLEREYRVHVGRELQGLRFRFRVRDITGNLSVWSTTRRSLPPF